MVRDIIKLANCIHRNAGKIKICRDCHDNVHYTMAFKQKRKIKKAKRLTYPTKEDKEIMWLANIPW